MRAPGRLSRSNGRLPVYLWYNGQCPHSASVVVSLFHTALLRNLTRKKEPLVRLVNSPLVGANGTGDVTHFERLNGRLSLPAGERIAYTKAKGGGGGGINSLARRVTCTGLMKASYQAGVYNGHDKITSQHPQGCVSRFFKQSQGSLKECDALHATALDTVFIHVHSSDINASILISSHGKNQKLRGTILARAFCIFSAGDLGDCQYICFRHKHVPPLAL